MRTVRLLAAAALALLVLVVGAAPADAHPLGNFTLNRYARVEVSGPIVRTYYVEDLAELAAFARRDEVRRDPVGYRARRSAALAAGLRLEVDGAPAALRVVTTRLDQPPGQGGLKTLRLSIIFESGPFESETGSGGSSTVGEHRVSIADGNEPDRAGWREILAVARSGARITASTVSSKDQSDELRRYPADLIGSPLDVRAASFSFTPGGGQADALVLVPPAASVGRYGGSLTKLITQGAVGPLALLGTLALAALLGASHALLPGHGKTVMAAYLVGSRGRPADAVALGVLVSLMHTASVLILGLVLFRASQSLAVERAYPALTALSGLLAMLVGGYLVAIRLRRYRSGRAVVPDHAHGGHAHGDHAHGEHAHGDHAHDQQHSHVLQPDLVAVGGAPTTVDGERAPTTDHDHGHGHDHDADHDHGGHEAHGGRFGFGHDHGPGGHSHLPPEGVAPLSRRGLVVLAGSGGLVPSPTAVVVLVASFSLGRAGLGLGIVAAFSVGLAVTLTAVGLALVLGRDVAERHLPPSALRILPIVGGAGMVVLGLGLVAQGIGVV